MIKHYFLTELRLLTRHKTRFVLAVLLPVTFYLLFTSILDLPQPIMAKFNQEYMYNMTTFSLMSFCLFSFPFDIIDERTRGWYKRLMRTPLTPAHYIGIKIGKTMCQFALSIVIIFTIAAQFKGVQFAYALNPAKQGLLAMVLREAMNNIIKHADATTVHVALSETTDGLQLDIQDNGCGIRDKSPIHLQSIQARVEVLKGQLHIENNEGLHIQILIPRSVAL
ncbi:hypothetical protein O0G71_03780 [Staphylococcus pseudintermedius]|nr:hypothetical protein [Staphylococcus pseudintermedius]